MRMTMSALLFGVLAASAHAESPPLPAEGAVCPRLTIRTSALPNGLNLIAVASPASSDEVVGILSLSWGGEEKYGLCVSSMVHEGDQFDASYLRRIDLSGGWRNAACPAARCSLQFGIPRAHLREAFQAMGERFLAPRVSPETVTGRLKYVPVAGVSPPEFAGWCSTQDSVTGATLIVVGPVTPEAVFDAATAAFGIVPPGNPDRTPREVKTLQAAFAEGWLYDCVDDVYGSMRVAPVLKLAGDLRSAAYTPHAAHICPAALLMRTTR